MRKFYRELDYNMEELFHRKFRTHTTTSHFHRLDRIKTHVSLTDRRVNGEAGTSSKQVLFLVRECGGGGREIRDLMDTKKPHYHH